MKHLRHAAVIVGVLGGTCAPLSAFLVACSTNETGVVNADGSLDGKGTHADSPFVRDVVTHIDTGHEAGPHDAGQDTGTETGPRETGPGDGGDSGDTGVAETGRDAPADVQRDTGHDAGIDAQPFIAAYPNKVTTAYCQRFAECCGNNPAVFSVAACVAYFESNNVGGAVANVQNIVVDSGHLEYNSGSASDCLTQLATLNCTTVTSLEEIALTQACASAIQGTLALGESGCRSSWDCAQPAYCKHVADAGTCTALIAQGAACTDTIFSQDCTSLGNTPSSFCGPYSSTTPTCLTSEGDGGACEQAVQCDSLLCNGTDCVGSIPFAQLSDGGTCTYFPPVDAGP